jgi:hypothetical protein
LPSLENGWGMVIEAMSCGLTVMIDIYKNVKSMKILNAE